MRNHNQQTLLPTDLPRPLRISLVSPPVDDRRGLVNYVFPPLGLLSIAAYLENAGHQVTVHDFIFDLKRGRMMAGPSLYPRCADRILASDPDLVGFSMQCVTNPGAINIAHHLKKQNPFIRILLGGHDISFLGREYMNAFPFVDLVISGEGELSTVKLASAIQGERDLTSVPGLWYRSPDTGITHTTPPEFVADLDAMPEPAFHLVDDIRVYFQYSKHPTILVESGRGCAYSCEFCQTTQLSGHRVRYRSSASLIGQLMRYRSRYGPFEAYFVHDLFSMRRSFVVDLCRRLIQERLDITWACRCRLDQADPEMLSLMGQAGCRRILYGAESGSEKVLDIMNKRFDGRSSGWVVGKTRQTIDAGIYPTISMLIGTPEETFADLNATLELAADLAGLKAVSVFLQLLSPLPGTPLAHRLRHRVEFRGQDLPSGFSTGIEFLNGKWLPEDARLISQWPELFLSFRTIVPAHGDIDLCLDVAAAYVTLLSMYGQSFVGLARHFRTTLLDLFRRFRRFVCTDLSVTRLYGLEASAIGEGFRMFAAECCRGGPVPERLKELVRYESMIQAAIAGNSAQHSPRPEGASCPTSPSDQGKSPMRIFRTPYDLPGMPPRRGPATGQERCLLLAVVNDQIKVVDLGDLPQDSVEIFAAILNTP